MGWGGGGGGGGEEDTSTITDGAEESYKKKYVIFPAVQVTEGNDRFLAFSPKSTAPGHNYGGLTARTQYRPCSFQFYLICIVLAFNPPIMQAMQNEVIGSVPNRAS